jgi:hypothetical protein
MLSIRSPSSGHSLCLIDRGANGGVAGSDVCVIVQTSCTKDTQGIDITVGGFI